MAELTLKNLPDPSKIEDDKSYMLRGVHVRTFVELIYQLWRGENIGNSSSVKKNSNGDSGFNLTIPPNQNAVLGSSVGASPILAALQPSSDVSTNSNPKYTITYGTYGGIVPTISGTALSATTALNIITLGSSDQVVYMQCDFTYNTSTGAKTIVDAKIMSATETAFDLLVSSVSGGTGVLYQRIFGVTITAPVGSGPYTVVAAPVVAGSQNFGVCISYAGTSISGPWLV